MPKISVIVPVYNGEKFINKCLDSLLFQDLKDIEIIVINDGSVDQTEYLIRRRKIADERIKLLRRQMRE